MKFISSVAVAITALVASAPLAAAKQSAAFDLVVISSNATLNGSYLFAGHEGAGIAGLLVGSAKEGKADTFKLNDTSAYPNQGSLNWLEVGGNFKEYIALELYVDPSTNVALPLFEPGYDYVTIGFDSSNKMYIPTYLDDTKTPPTSVNGKKLYRWLICETYYSGYTYTTLAWQQGSAAAENPTCQKVSVKRVFT